MKYSSLLGVTVDADKFAPWFAKNASGVRFFLLYGQDEGGVFLTQQNLIERINRGGSSCDIERVAYAEVAANPDILKNMLSSNSLFALRKIVLVQECGESINQAILKILKNGAADLEAFVIFVAGEIKKSSRIVKGFENLSGAVIVPCYKLDQRGAEAFIANWLKAKLMAYTQELTRSLVSFLPLSRRLIVNELERLFLYSAGREIAIEDVEVFFQEQNLDMALDVLCYGFCLGLREIFVSQLFKALENNCNEIFILRALQNYLARVRYVQFLIANGKSLDESLVALTPPIFFKYKHLLIEVVRKTPPQRINDLLVKLLEYEVLIKTKSIYKIAQMLQQLVCSDNHASS